MTVPDWKSRLCFGDNLELLGNHVGDASVDPVYLDPPFNSNANYHVLFRECPGMEPQDVITANAEALMEHAWNTASWARRGRSRRPTGRTRRPPDALQSVPKLQSSCAGHFPQGSLNSHGWTIFRQLAAVISRYAPATANRCREDTPSRHLQPAPRHPPGTPFRYECRRPAPIHGR